MCIVMISSMQIRGSYYMVAGVCHYCLCIHRVSFVEYVRQFQAKGTLQKSHSI